MKRLPLLALLLLASPAQGQWPAVREVEAQPLIAQVTRLVKAFDLLGQPLPAETRKALEALTEDDGDEKVTAAVQKHLDPLSLTAIEVRKGGSAMPVPRANRLKIIEQGWKAVLVKVVNTAGTKNRWWVQSAHALRVPGSRPDKVAERWLDLMPFHGQPMLPNLSGLGLEYVILQVYSRDPGAKKAEMQGLRVTSRLDCCQELDSVKREAVGLAWQ